MNEPKQYNHFVFQHTFYELQLNDFLINQYDLKKLFKLTTIVMFLDRSHQQNNNYNESQASYIVNELLDLVKNAYNNEKVINWRN